MFISINDKEWFIFAIISLILLSMIFFGKILGLTTIVKVADKIAKKPPANKK